jgi:putative ABC transport system permease protein
MMFTVGDATLEESKKLQKDLHHMLAARHQVSVDDQRAMRTQNNLERFSRVTAVFTWVNGFVWFVSLGTLLAGMVSVSNIMLISVAERTREIGVRKALGATPVALIWMVLFESVIITATAGYAGLVAGVGVVELAAQHLTDTPFIRDPSVDMRTALTLTAMVVAAGVLAGLFPALRAARVNPIAALRDD